MKAVRMIWVMLLCAASVGAQAASYRLNSTESSLGFVSIKAGDVAEAHRFGELSGQIDENGAARVSIALASVDTGIEIRDERMREMLFETAEHSAAEVSADVASLLAQPAGSARNVSLPVTIDLHGSTVEVQAEVSVRALGNGDIEVVTLRPVLIHAAQFGLAQGVQQLQDIAGLPSISLAVPVTFRLLFNRLD